MGSAAWTDSNQGNRRVAHEDWSSRWPDQARYRNMDAGGVMHFPGYSVRLRNS